MANKEYNGVRLESITRGQAWRERGDLDWLDKRENGNVEAHIVRVMVVSDGYVMVRVKGCLPFTVFWKDLIADYDRVTAFDSPRAVDSNTQVAPSSTRNDQNKENRNG